MDTLLHLDFTLDPTFNIYEANRDLHVLECKNFTTTIPPSLWKFYAPAESPMDLIGIPEGTEQEVQWKEIIASGCSLSNEFKTRVWVFGGTDSGLFINYMDFSYPRELELLREAGFHPLEIIRSATLYGAQALGADKEIGSLEPGKLADIVLVDQNPLKNLQVLYGTGAVVLNEKMKR